MTAQDIIDMVRDEISDDIREYRWSDAKMISVMNDALRELNQDRPDALLAADGTYTALVDITLTTDTILFGDEFRQAIMHYMAYRLLSKDSEDDTNMTLAGSHLSQYRQFT